MTDPSFEEMIAVVNERGGEEAELLAKHGAAIEEWSEDGGLYVARGHMEPVRFVGLLREWAERVYGCDPADPWLEDLSTADVVQSWAVPDDGTSLSETWTLQGDSDAPHAMAITWVEI